MTESIHENPRVWVPRLRGALDRQYELYERLDALSREQSGLVRADDTRALLGVLAERQTVIDQITRVNEEIEPFRRSWDRLTPLLSDDERATLSERLDALAELIEQITRRDDADRAALEQRRTDVAKELGVVSRGRGALAAYGGRPGTSGPKFQDREG